MQRNAHRSRCHPPAQADDDEKAPNVEELFGSDDEDDDYNPSAANVDEQDALDDEAMPQSKQERLAALSNKIRRAKVLLGWYYVVGMTCTHLQEVEAEDAARRKRRRSSEAEPVDTQDLFGEEDDEEEEAPPAIDQEFDGEGQVTDADRNFIDDAGTSTRDDVLSKHAH